MTLTDWKQDVVTIEVMAELKRRIVDQTNMLVISAGVDPRIDSFRSGVIAALNDVVDFKFEEAQDD